jgi:hypothetical protein
MAQPPPLPPSREPVPVHPLSYADRDVYDTGRRPGILVTMGIVSVGVGVLALIMNWWTYAPAKQLYEWSEPPQVAAPQVVVAAAGAASVTPHAGDYIRARGLKHAARARVIAAVEQRGKLLSDRREMLDRLLADAGAEAFGGVGDSSVVEAPMVSRVPDGPDGTGLGPDIVRTRLGTIEIQNQTATFTATADGRVVSERFITFVEPGAPARWSAWAIDQALERAHRRNSTGLSALQWGAIAAELRGLAPRTKFNGWELPELSISKDLGSGTFSGIMEGQEFWVMADGRLLYPPTDADWDPATGAARVKPTQVPMLLPIPRWAAVTLLTDVWASAALGLLLILAGVGVMSEAPWSGELHRIYATLKLILIVITVIGSGAMLLSWERVRQAAAQRGLFLPDTTNLTGRTVLGAIMWLIYPAVVLGVLASRRVRAYYQRIGSVPWMVPPAAGRCVRNSRVLWVVVAVVAALLAIGQGLLLTGAIRSGDGGVPVGSGFWLVACAGVAALALYWLKNARRAAQ